MICPHWWVLESPHDGLSRVAGVCKRCGVAKPEGFPASFEESRFIRPVSTLGRLFTEHDPERRNTRVQY